eukprot:Opistho-2@17864
MSELLCAPEATGQDDEQSGDDRVILSVVWKAGKLGAAYYEVETGHLRILNDVSESGCFEYLRSVILQARPTAIITSSKQSEKFIDVLRESLRGVDGNVEDADAPLQILPSTDFNMESCRVRLLNMDLASFAADLTPKEREMQISGLIDFQAHQMVGLYVCSSAGNEGFAAPTGSRISSIVDHSDCGGLHEPVS